MKSKRDYGKWRAISLSSVYLLMGLHIAHWQINGKTLAPLEFNEVLYTIHRGILTAGFLFMALTMIGTLVLGRFFCSWMCHILALQDGSAWLLSKLGIRPRHIRSRFFFFIPFLAAIYLFILPQVEKLIIGVPASGLQVLSDEEGWASFTTTDYWRNLPGIGITLLTFFVCGFLIIYFLGSRTFCQYACPYGALFSVADRIAPGKIILSGDCNQCGLCTAACNSHILVHKEVGRFGKVVDHNCLKDLDCVQACPNDALKFGFTKPSGFKSLSRGTSKEYDFSKGEDIFVAAAFLVYASVFRGLYDAIPFLLAIAISIILAFFSVYALRLFRTEFVRINRFSLKHSNKLTAQGKWFLAFFLLMTVFTVHSGFVHYHAYTGEIAYNQILSASLSGSAIDKTKITPGLNKALHHLESASSYGLYTPASVDRQLASLYLTAGRIPEAKDRLEKLLAELPGDQEGHLRYAKILIGESQEEMAIGHLMNILNDASTAKKSERQIRSEASLMMGRLREKHNRAAEANGFFRKALSENPGNAEAMLALGASCIRTGNYQEAEEVLLRAETVLRNSPVLENNLSVLFLKTRQYEKAIVHMNQLLALQPGNVEVQYNIAMARFAMGETKQALEILNAILARVPDYRNSMIAVDLITSNKLHLTEAAMK